MVFEHEQQASLKVTQITPIFTNGSSVTASDIFLRVTQKRHTLTPSNNHYFLPHGFATCAMTEVHP